MIPQIPNFSASPAKKSKPTPTPYSQDYDEAEGPATSIPARAADQDSAFVSRLLGPLSGNIDESPPTPSPIYAAGTAAEP